MLIAPFPSSAASHLETLLSNRVDEAKILATELARITKDRYPGDLVARNRSADVFAFLRQARQAEQELNPTRAAELYQKGIRTLDRDDPLALSMRLHQAGAQSLSSYQKALPLLAPIEREARSRGYGQLAARTQATRANALYRLGRFPEAILEYDRALTTYRQLGNDEGAASTLLRRSGVLREAGLSVSAWRNALEALRLGNHLGSYGQQHALLGEVADTAMALGHPQAALVYQNATVRFLQAAKFDRQLWPALRSRAATELRLGHVNRAKADLEAAMRFAPPEGDPVAARIVRARTEEITARTLLKSNPAEAVAAFTRAFESASPEFPTFRASLLAQRAEAQRLAGQKVEADQDLVSAVAELTREQTRNLEHRKRGQAEELWSRYFSRFQDVYRTLVREYVEQGRIFEALQYAEQARSVEPLYLAQKKAVPFDLAALKAALPPGTFLLEYAVLNDRTVVWIVSRDGLTCQMLETPQRRIAQWSSAIQNGTKNTTAFANALDAAYEELMAKPLAEVKQPIERLVIVPDDAMHGLPFPALHDAKSDRYLIERAPIEVAGSARLYLLSLRRDDALRTSSDHSLLLVGNPTLDLPYAKSEVMSINDIYAHNVQTLLDRDATIARFLAVAPRHSMIHIAAHSMFDIETPFRSFIRLAPSPKDDGRLFPYDLLVKFPKTRLIVLSSCSSAGGGPVGPEGVAPLVRPLIAAGVPAVVGTLWNVDDATAKELLVSFHRDYEKGTDAAAAMRAAQLAMLRNINPGLQRPSAWAPFEVIGYSSSPFAAARRK